MIYFSFLWFEELTLEVCPSILHTPCVYVRVDINMQGGRSFVYLFTVTLRSSCTFFRKPFFLVGCTIGKYTLPSNSCLNVLENRNSYKINVMGMNFLLIFCVQLVRNIFTSLKNVGNFTLGARKDACSSSSKMFLKIIRCN